MLNIILYIDELVPGNALRHDMARKMHGIYWTFAELPQWLLCRTSTWFCFGVIRSSIVKDFPGQVSQLMAMVLKVFFTGATTFENGIHVFDPSKQRAILLRSRFGGFLGDEKGLKEIYDCKGQAGTMPCLKCGNILGSQTPSYSVEPCLIQWAQAWQARHFSQ